MAQWPLREVLIAYLEHLRSEVRADWHRRYVRWALTAPHVKPGQERPAPQLPTWIEDDDDGT